MDKEKEIPAAATVLTDERIFDLVAQHRSKVGSRVDPPTFSAIEVLSLCRAIEAQVLAQAGVRAEPTAWMYQDDADKASPGSGSCVVSKARSHFYRNETPLYAAPTIPAQVPAAEVRAQALDTLNRDGWKIDGSLIYRLNDKGVNCDEINITMVNGSRAAEVRHDAAVELLAELSSTADKASEVRAALERDAARYRFLRYADLDAMAASYWPEGQVPEGEAFDSAIDAALAAAPSTADSGNTGAQGEGADIE
jgi:hypothetical protein